MKIGWSRFYDLNIILDTMSRNGRGEYTADPSGFIIGVSEITEDDLCIIEAARSQIIFVVPRKIMDPKTSLI